MKAYFTRRRLLLLLAAVVFTALLALILRDFVREYVVLPLLNLGWLAWIGMMGVPQAVYWGIFLLLAVLIAVRSLSADPSRLRTRFERHVQRYNAPSRYGHWQVGLASLAHSSFAHERVERELQTLAVQVLAEQRRVAVEELRDQMLRGTLDLSAEAAVIQDLFKLDPHAILPLAPRGLAAWLARLFGRSALQIDPRLDIPGIVAWLEEQTGSGPTQTGSSSRGQSGAEKSRSIS